MNTCSVQSRLVGEPLPGTAPHARVWIVIEQPGAWGRKALHDAALPAGLGARLAGLVEGHAATILLARHPSNRRTVESASHQVWIAHAGPGVPRMTTIHLTDLNEIADWDITAITNGDLPGTAVDEPLVLVCTQGGRDACCAVLGRPLLGEVHRLVGDHSGRVWESSHIGGHRFAPTVLSLPSGAAYGRVTADDVVGILNNEAVGTLALQGLRGRTCLPQPWQVAEIAVRERAQVDRLDSLTVEAPASTDTDAQEVDVRHVDGRTWRVRVQRVTLPDMRAESCLGEPLPVNTWQVVDISEQPEAD
jgi:hypothetical protein